MSILIFVLGAIFGSFFLVVAERGVRRENMTTSRSHCDHCQHILKWYDLIPILSFIFLKGRCRYCQNKISIINLLMELVTSLLFLIGYLYFGFTIKYAIYLVLISLALIIFITDFKYMIILDTPLIVSSILLIILKYFEVGLLNSIYAIIYGIVLFIIMYLIKLLGDKIYHRESLGGGDIKLAFLMGLTLGYPGIGLRMGLISLILASFLALPYAMAQVYLIKKNELPYGPFLIASTIMIFVFFDKFVNVLLLFSL